MDSRTSSILINLDLKNVASSMVSDKYLSSKNDIAESEKGYKMKSYGNLRSTLKECYLIGSLKYGNNYIM